MKKIIIDVHTGLGDGVWEDFQNAIFDTCNFKRMDVDMTSTDIYNKEIKKSNCKCGKLPE